MSEMQIEEYRVEELGAEEMKNLAADGQAAMLIEKLGLAGQKKLLSATGTRQPFRRITNIEREVFKELFPQVSELSQYETEIMPVRVLELAGQAMESGYFCKLEIWHSRTRRDDPILIGVVGKVDPQTWDPHYTVREAEFLIARWGKALASFADLQQEAIKQWLADETLALSTKIDELGLKLKRVAERANAKFLSGQDV